MSTITKPAKEWEFDALTTPTTPSLLLSTYQKHMILVIRNYTVPPTNAFSKLSKAFQNATPTGRQAVQSSFATESTTKERLTPSSVFGNNNQSNINSSSWYCSFVAQGCPFLLQQVLQVIPTDTTTTTTNEASFPQFLKGHRQGNAAWVFVGKRSTSESFAGRSEHVDRILHDGTYHLQCAGQKIWSIRPDWKFRKESQPPTNKQELPSNSAWRTEDGGIEIVCNPGDLILVNTKMWAHRTTIPKVEEEDNHSNMSISIARDFYLTKENGGKDEKKRPHDKSHDTSNNFEMGNVDTLFSTRSIKKGEVVFNEAEFAVVASSGTGLAMCSPNDANVDVVRLESSGEVVIIALRDIQVDEIIMLADPNYQEEIETEPDKKKRKKDD